MANKFRNPSSTLATSQLALVVLASLILATLGGAVFAQQQPPSSAAAGEAVNDNGQHPSSSFLQPPFETTKPRQKVQVNVLYLSQATDTPMFLRETFANDTSLPTNSDESKSNDSIAWLGNSQLKYINVSVILRDTKYRPEFNLRKTFAVILEQLSASPSLGTTSSLAAVCSANNTENTTAVSSTTTPSSPPTIHIIVGPVYSGEAKAMSLFTSFYNLVLISGSASSPTLGDRSRYPYFFRTCPSDGDGPNVLANVLSYFGYNQLNMLYFDEGFVLDLKEMLEPNFRSRGVAMENSFVLYQHDNRSFSHMADVLSSASTRSHIWMTFLSSDDYANYELLCALAQYAHVDGSTHLGFVFGEATSEEAQWWNPPQTAAQTAAPTADNNSSTSDLPPPPPPAKYLYAGDCTAEQLRAVLNGAIHIIQSAADYADRKADLVDLRPSEFKRRMRVALDTNGYGAENFYSYLYFQFDAFTAAAMALDRVERSLRRQFNTSLSQFHYNDSRVVKSVFENLSNMSFQGLTGHVQFAADGNREHVGWILRQFQDTSFVTVGAYEATNATAFNVTLIRPLVFPTSDGKAPPQFVFTTWATPTNIALIVLAALLVVFGLPLAVWLVRRQIAENALRSALLNTSHWLIDTELLVSDEMTLNRSSRLSLMLTNGQSSMSIRSGNLKSQRSMSASAVSGVAAAMRNRRPYLTFIYKQKNSSSRVCLFPLKKRNDDAKNYSTQKSTQQQQNDDNVTIDREFISQLVRTQECQHDNLSRFVGITPIEIESVASYHVTMAGFSAKGSLTDFITQTRANGDVMDVACSFSMLKDLQKGLVEVHRHLGFHGRLSSAICMIDNRLSLRVNDYGFTQYRQAAFFSNGSQAKTIEYEDWLWTAPEVLARQFGVQSKTISDLNSAHLNELPSELPLDWQLCDVYSFGIIVAEIFSCCHPFDGDRLDSTTTLELLQSIVNDSSQISKMVQETCTENEVPEDVKAFVQRCVNADPKSRSSLTEVGVTLNTMMRARKLSDNLTEMLMQRLEMYAANLESVVEQRTLALVEEENKVRRLLYQILPATVADALKNGESVPPQTFASVTIYFSDIVGFTTISASSTPLQVVDLLNDLYNSFDKILSTFDVYKVETIGDAYMVVSGLPKPNGQDHVLHIARMSVTLIDHVTGNFRMRHKPDEQLKLRIGMHTGGCAAGVVGFVMPRYCLFGDTVNTASRMESTGEPLRIHTSEASATALRMLGVVDGGETGEAGLPVDGSSTTVVPEFELCERGIVEVKGKGNMRTFWLTRKDE